MDKRAVIIARVSTDGQAEHGRSIASQLAAMRAYAEHAGFQVIAEIQDDISGTVPIRERPGGRQLYEFIDGRRADAVIFYAVDRITRDEDLIALNVLRRDCRDAGIELHYSADGGKADLSTWGGVIDTLKAAGAAEERKKIVERTMRNKRAKAQAGKWVGTGYTPYGYRKEGKGRDARLVIDWAEAAIVRRIFAMYLGTDDVKPLTALTIGKTLTLEGVPAPARGKAGKGWYVSVITRILRNRAYIGEFKSYGYTITLSDLAIIEPATFNLAQAHIESRRNIYRANRRRDYLMTGHLKCTCGKAMCGHASGGQPYYVCTWQRRARYMSNCTERGVKTAQVDAVVWEWVKGIISNEADLIKALERVGSHEDDLQPLRDQLRRIEADISRVEGRIRRLMSAFGDERDDLIAVEYQAQIEQAKRDRATLTVERDRVKANIERDEMSHQQKADILLMAQELRQIIADADFEEQRYILHRLGMSAQLERAEDGDYVNATCIIGDASLLMGRYDSAGVGMARPRAHAQCRRSTRRCARRQGRSRCAARCRTCADQHTIDTAPSASHARECAVPATRRR